jgi:hypothetical protein
VGHDGPDRSNAANRTGKKQRRADEINGYAPSQALRYRRIPYFSAQRAAAAATLRCAHHLSRYSVGVGNREKLQYSQMSFATFSRSANATGFTK